MTDTTTTPTAPSTPGTPGTPGTPILVWDLPVRLFHWLMVASFAGAWITAESERWRLVHVTLGTTLAGLIVFRLLWGVVGTRHARFTDFVRGPRRVLGYLRSLVQGRAEHHTGHNPAGALAIVVMLALGAATTAFGWAAYNDLGGEWAEEGHELAANLMMLVVGVHVAGVALSSWLHRENLVRSMITGRKLGAPQDGIRRAWASVAALMLTAVLGFWWLQWQDAPANAAAASATSATSATAGPDNVQVAGQGGKRRHHDDDD